MYITTLREIINEHSNLDRFQVSELRLERSTNPPVNLNNKQLCLFTYSSITVFKQRLQLLH